MLSQTSEVSDLMGQQSRGKCWFRSSKQFYIQNISVRQPFF